MQKSLTELDLFYFMKSLDNLTTIQKGSGIDIIDEISNKMVSIGLVTNNTIIITLMVSSNK